MNRAVKTIGRALLRLGGLDLVRYGRRSALRILMYHRFAGMEEGFARQCDHLRARYHPIALSEAVSRLRDGSPLGPHSVVVTIDDGYRDSYTSALPILEARRIPATVFLTTDFLDGRLWLWTDQLEYAVQHTGAREAVVCIPDREPLRLALATKAEKASAIRRLKETLKTVPNAARLQVLGELPGLLGVDLPASAPENWQPLSWDEVRAMARGGLIEFGGHSCSHPILSRVEERDELDREIGRCRARIEEELQQPARHFCYPNGRAEDVGPAVMEATRRAGYDSGISTIPGMNDVGADPFLLHRLGTDPDAEFPWFEELVAGVRVS